MFFSVWRNRNLSLWIVLFYMYLTMFLTFDIRTWTVEISLILSITRLRVCAKYGIWMLSRKRLTAATIFAPISVMIFTILDFSIPHVSRICVMTSLSYSAVWREFKHFAVRSTEINDEYSKKCTVMPRKLLSAIHSVHTSIVKLTCCAAPILFLNRADKTSYFRPSCFFK